MNVRQHPKRIRNMVHNAMCRCYGDYHLSKNYSGRGITVCQEWIKNPSDFANYLMTLEGWSVLGNVLDRVDNNKGYEPGNLRFVTRSESGINRRQFTRRVKYPPTTPEEYQELKLYVAEHYNELKRVREKFYATVTDFARAIRVDLSAVCKIEKGQYPEGSGLLKLILEVYWKMEDEGRPA